MILSFTAIDHQAKFRDFWCQLSELEVALDVLSMVASKGDTILKALIIDEGSCTELPIDAFDGELFSDPMHQLEEEWQAILKEPLQPVVANNEWHIELTRHQIKIYDDRIAQFLLVVSQFEQLRERAELVTQYEPQRSKLINHYNSTLSTYRHYIDRAKAGQQVAQEKLSQLLS